MKTSFLVARHRLCWSALTAVLVLSACAACAGVPGVDYLNSPTRVRAPASAVAERGPQDTPVVAPSAAGPGAPASTAPGGLPGVCDLLRPTAVEQVSGLTGLSATAHGTTFCAYTSPTGGMVFRVTANTYPEAPRPSAVLDAALAPYAEVESVQGLGDCAGYAPDTGTGLPPSLFIVTTRSDTSVVLLVLALDPVSTHPRSDLIALGEVAVAHQSLA